MRLKDLEKILRQRQYKLIRNGKHRVYSNGSKHVAVPHNRNLNRFLAERIIREL